MPGGLTGFSLVAPPPGFVEDPYPFYAALRAGSPVHRLGPDAVLLTRHADVMAARARQAASGVTSSFR